MDEKQDNTARTGFEIAVIGMAGRFPGARDIEQFWDNLKNSVEAVTFFSQEQLAAADVESQILDDPYYVKTNGGLLEDKDWFDAAFFDYNPAEAEAMDPQMRLFHEYAWAALEDAGCNPETYNGLIGLYGGASAHFNWEALCHASGKNETLGEFLVSQLIDKDYLCARVAYKLNLKGPALTVQTACSTSLVALHTACRALLSGECDMALAGGVSVSSLPGKGYLYREGMILSPDGHCRAFDARAEGTVKGEGIGIVALKSLEDAIANGDYIYAVVKSSAVNNDGCRKAGFTAPSVAGQAEVIRAALHMAEVEPESIGYIETHGTGTTLGDPIEIQGLKMAFDTDKKGFCAIGSVKTNVGHLDSAAGIAGFIKAILAIYHRQIPPSLHFEIPNPGIDFENSPFFVNTELREWKSETYPLRAGVSSFGIGGTNAHVVLEEWRATHPPDKSSRDYHLILLSARTESALEKITENLVNYFIGPIKPGNSILSDAAYTLQVGRKHFSHRRMVTGSTVEEVAEILSSKNSDKVRTHTLLTDPREKLPVVFMFPGQGAQYVNMGFELYQKEAIFRQEMDRCFDILEPIMGCNIKEILYSSAAASEMINRTEITQPVIFILEYALAKLLNSWGIIPYAMIGHSIGEYTAACLAGVFSLEDALALVTLRGQLMQQMPEGSMLSLPLPEQEIQPLLKENLSLAAVNAPCRCVVSGPDEAIDIFAREMTARGYKTTRLHTSHAFHSHMMEPILETFAEKVKEVPLHEPGIPYISNVTGNWAGDRETVDPVYWAQHLRQTVRYSDGIKILLEVENVVFVEVGPGSTLSTLVKQHNQHKQRIPAVNLVPHPRELEDNQGIISDGRYFQGKVGQLWLYGAAPDWSQYHRGEKGRRIPLPTYPFEGKRFRVEGDISKWAGEPREPHEADRLPQDAFLKESEEPGAERQAAPRDKVEKAIAAVWEGFFGFDVGIYDNFFEIGGDSLKAVELIASLHKRMNIKISLGQFFKTPTISGLARYAKSVTTTPAEDSFISIEATEEKEYYAATSAQKRLYILQQLEPDNIAYNLPNLMQLDGPLQKEKLEGIFSQLIYRHESFRTSFRIVDEEPVQVVHKTVDFSIEYRDLPLLSQFMRPFDLSRPPLLRAALVKEAEEKHILMVDIHHTVYDGTSSGILAREFMELYRQKELAPLGVQYKDYALWQNNGDERERLKRHEEWWLKEFSGDIPVLDLPLDYARPVVQSFEGSRMVFEEGPQELKALKKLALEQGGTLYMVLLAIYSILMSKLSSQEEMVIGAPAAGRNHPDLEPIIGMFVKTLPLRLYPGANKTCKEFLKEVVGKTLEALENQEYPFEDLVDRLTGRINRDTGRNPLFDVSFILQNMEIPTLEIPGLILTPCPIESEISKFDLTLETYEIGEEKLQCILEYCTRLFKPETIERFTGYFSRILAAVINNPGQKISQIEIISEAEKRKILEDFNNAAPGYPGNKTLHQLFAEQVEKAGDKIAVIGMARGISSEAAGGLAPQSTRGYVTYRNLNKKSLQMAGVLKERGVGPDTIVGIMAERSIEMIVGILGILKTGGAYLPIEPGYPEERINYIMADSGAKVLLKKSEIRISKFETNPNDRNSNNQNRITTPIVLNFEHLGFEFVSDFGFRISNLNSSNLAYIIYTSGSTGRPKGVMVEHGSVINLLHALEARYPCRETDAYLVKTSFLFDVSVTELFGWWRGGGRIVLLERGGEKDPQTIIDTIEMEKITHINFVPSMFEVFLDFLEEPGSPNLAALKSLKYIFLAGEALGPGLVRTFDRLNTGIPLENLYGPTESTVYASAYSLKDWDGESPVPIGKPIDNIQLVVVNKELQIQPVGVPGELCISGTGLARGYLNRPELTAERFVISHLSLVNGQSLILPMTNDQCPMTFYHTGDLARWLPNGDIQFLGRIDHQVKIRGFRIELGEIENQLLKHENIKQTIVIDRKDTSGERCLCAYFVPADGNGADGLREYLSQTLPGYMIPSFFVTLDRIPLTPTGKVNRRALPGPEIEADPGYVAPGTALEQELGKIWAEVLGIDINHLSIDANLFELGGNSLKIIKVNRRLKEVLNRDIPVVTMFRFNTIRALARYLDQAPTQIQAVDEIYEKTRNEEVDKGRIRAAQALRIMKKN